MLEAIIPFTGHVYDAHQHLESLFKRPRTDMARDYIFYKMDQSILVRRESSNTETSDWGWSPVPQLVDGETVDILWVACPMSKLGKRASREKAVVRPIRDPEEQIKWAKNRLNDNGMDLVKYTMSDHDAVITPNRKRHFTINGIEISGTVVVTDAAKANLALSTGIGSGKPYGFGTIIVMK